MEHRPEGELMLPEGFSKGKKKRNTFKLPGAGTCTTVFLATSSWHSTGGQVGKNVLLLCTAGDKRPAALKFAIIDNGGCPTLLRNTFVVLGVCLRCCLCAVNAGIVCF